MSRRPDDSVIRRRALEGLSCHPPNTPHPAWSELRERFVRGREALIEGLSNPSPFVNADRRLSRMVFSIPPGTRLADHYEIERELGSGGMATVYLAHDDRHHRRVALKVLREDLGAASGATRFLREIQIAAQLQHPNILPLHHSGEALVDGRRVLFFVMPYVEGRSLRQRLDEDGALPVADAVRLLVEVVDALACAHGQGVVHRDIKPDNVMLSGRHALVADFGVAKAVSVATGQGPLTTTGIAVGTPAYMAPEQVTADPALDHRADIYAVGILGYELLTGAPPFTGPTPQQVLAAQITTAPAPLRTSHPEVPAQLERVLMKCLAKLPGERWQTAAELLAALEPLAAPNGARPDASNRLPGGSRLLVGVAATGLTIALVAAGATWWGRRAPAAPDLGRATQLTSEPGLELFPAISPDGKVVAYAAGNSARMRIYLRPVRGGRILPLSTDSSAVETQPSWSPEGDQILYLSRGGVSVASSLGGGGRQVLGPSASADVVSAAWSPAGDSLAIVRGDSLFIHPVAGGAGRFVVRAPEWHSCAWSSLRGQLACVAGNRDYVRVGQDFANQIPSAVVVLSLAGGQVIPVTDTLGMNLSPHWSNDGKRLFFISSRDGPRDVYMVPIDDEGRARGRPQRVTTGLGAHSMTFDGTGGRLTYAVYREHANLWSLPIPPRGRAPVGISGASQLTSGSQVVETMSVSPDQRWVYFDSNIGGSADIYRMPVGGGEIERLTSDSSYEFFAVAAPDGREFAFHSPRAGTRDMYVQRVGEAAAQRVTSSSMQECCAAWSPDGRAIAFTDYLGERGVFVIRRDQAGKWGTSTRLADRGFVWDWSGDGTLIAVTSGRRLRSSLPSERLELLAPGSGVMRTLYSAADTLRDPIVGLVQFTEDGSGVYFKSHDETGRASIWSMPLAGGRPTMLVRFDDPSRPSYRSNFAVGAGRFFFAVNDRQSDVWVADVVPR